MKRKFRLTSSLDFKRVRQTGRSYAHPLVVLVVQPDEETVSRFGIAAGRALGLATRRNRAKRLLREALRPLLGEIRPGWKALLIARRPLLQASLPEIQAAIRQLLCQAGLLTEDHGN